MAEYLFLASAGYVGFTYYKIMTDTYGMLEKNESRAETSDTINKLEVTEQVLIETDRSSHSPPAYIHLGTIAGIAFPIDDMKRESKPVLVWSHVKHTENGETKTITNPEFLTPPSGKVSYINTPEDLTNRFNQFSIDRSSVRLSLPLKLTHSTNQTSIYYNPKRNIVAENALKLSNTIARRKHLRPMVMIPVAAVAIASGYQALK